ncbi:MAG: hypothetical protein ABL933_06350 [Methyloglobulus sp.]
MKTSPTYIIIGLILFGFAGAYLQSKYKDRKLVAIVADEFNNLHLNTDGSFVYQEVSSNHNCNRSNITVVFSSNMNTQDICSSALSSLPPQTWEPYYQWGQKIKYCADREHTGDKFSPSWVWTSLRANNTAGGINLEIKAYPKSASNYTFMPVNQYAEHEIIQAAQKNGESFYYVHIKYQGPYDRRRYPCNDANSSCECVSSTYYKNTINELRQSQTLKMQ